MNDRFDRLRRGRRVGVHRAVERRWWRWWMTAIVALAACVVLVVGGLATLQLLRVGGVETTDLPGPQAVADPATLPEGTTVTLLDASGAGAADAVAASLGERGWPIAAVAGASEQRETTTVYYEGDLEPFALGIAEAIGTDSVEATQTPLSGSALTVIVGTGTAPAPSTGP